MGFLCYGVHVKGIMQDMVYEYEVCGGKIVGFQLLFCVTSQIWISLWLGAIKHQAIILSHLGSDNGLVLNDTKSLTDPMLTSSIVSQIKDAK